MYFCGGEANKKRTKRQAGSQRRRMPGISDRYDEEERWQTQDMMYCLLHAVIMTHTMMYRHGWLEKHRYITFPPYTSLQSRFHFLLQQNKNIFTRSTLEDRWSTNLTKMHLSHLHVSLPLSEAAESSCLPTCHWLQNFLTCTQWRKMKSQLRCVQKLR